MIVQPIRFLVLTSIRYDTRRVNECQSALQFKWTSKLVTHSTRLNCVSVSYRVHIEVTTEGILCRRQAHAYSLEEDFLDKMVLVKWGAKQSLYISIPPAILRLLPFFPLIEMCQGRYLVKSIFVGQSYYATRDSTRNPQIRSLIRYPLRQPRDAAWVWVTLHIQKHLHYTYKYIYTTPTNIFTLHQQIYLHYTNKYIYFRTTKLLQLSSLPVPNS